MDLLARIQGIILKPQEEWAKIKEEQTTVVDFFKSYLMILVAIPTVAQFIGYWVIGITLPVQGRIRVGFGFSLGRAVVYYVLTLASIFVAALIIDALAPTFSSRPNQLNALKLAGYSLTPYYVAGILYIFPLLGVLVMLAGLYSLYVFYLGFKAGLMETPPEKVMGYFVVTLLAEIVLSLIVGLVLGAIFSLSAIYRGF
jgi:hypothetical protein